MGKELLLAIDIGTTNLKAALFSLDGKVVAHASRRHQASRRYDGWAEHDAEKVWWKEFLEICAEFLKMEGISAKDIISVAFSSLSPALLPVDAGGKALYPAMLHGLDRRATQEISDLNKTLKDHVAGQMNGSATLLSTGPKILWLKRHEPEIFEKTAYFVGAPSFMVYRLTGNMVADYGCYRIGGVPFNNATFDWDDAMCGACGITRGQLPRLMFATEKAGTITQEAAALTGLAAGTPVAAGTGDYLAEKLSFGAQFRMAIQFTFGTTVGIDFGKDFCTILFPDYDPNNQPVAPRGGAMANGCSTIDWVISMISGIDAGKPVDDDRLYEMANSVPAGANGITILPYLNGEKTPFLDPSAKGMIFGLQARHTQADLYKASLESLAYSMRHIVADRAPNVKKEAVVMGGGIKIPMLLQTVSDVTGFQLTRLETTSGTLVGGAFIAGMACGVFTKREDIDSWVKIAEYIKPRAELSAIYDRGFQTYLDLYQATEDIMHRPALC